MSEIKVSTVKGKAEINMNNLTIANSISMLDSSFQTMTLARFSLETAVTLSMNDRIMHISRFKTMDKTYRKIRNLMIKLDKKILRKTYKETSFLN